MSTINPFGPGELLDHSFEDMLGDLPEWADSLGDLWSDFALDSLSLETPASALAVTTDDPLLPDHAGTILPLEHELVFNDKIEQSQYYADLEAERLSETNGGTGIAKIDELMALGLWVTEPAYDAALDPAHRLYVHPDTHDTLADALGASAAMTNFVLTS